MGAFLYLFVLQGNRAFHCEYHFVLFCNAVIRGIQPIRNVFFIMRHWGVSRGNDCSVDLGLILGLDISLLIAFCTNSLQGLIVAVLLPVNYLPGHNLPWRRNPAVSMAWKVLSTVFQQQTSPIVLMGKAAVLHIHACTHIVKLHL